MQDAEHVATEVKESEPVPLEEPELCSVTIVHVLSTVLSMCVEVLDRWPSVQDAEPAEKDVRIPEPVPPEDPDLDFGILWMYFDNF